MDAAKERVGADIAALIGGTVVNQVVLAVGQQAALPPWRRRHVAVLVDEFHALPAADSEGFLAELAKYGGSLVLATQSLGAVDALEPDRGLRHAVFANVDHLFAFNSSAEDARVLGPAFAGVLCTDFYAAYDHYAGPHQRCWGHLLRDIHDLVKQHPQDATLTDGAVQVHGLYESAMRCVATREPDAAVREREQHACEAELLARCVPYLPPPPEPGTPRPHRRRRDAAAPVQQTLCGRIRKYLPELFTIVADPAVESTNNAAERDIRPVVVQRKISGGTRSPTGTSTVCTLQTLFGTWRARNLDPLVACRNLLLASAAAPV